MCAPASSRPVIARARASAPSRSNAGSNSVRLEPALVGGPEALQRVDAAGCRRCGRARSGDDACSSRASRSIRARSCSEPLPLGELVHHVAEQRGADAAGRAEAAALVGEEVGEVARHLEHVARCVEDHERAGRGQVLEGDAAVELRGADADARRPADLHRLRVARRRSPSSTCAHRDAERVLVDARPRAVARHREQLGAGRLRACRSPAYQSAAVDARSAPPRRMSRRC